MGSEVKYGIINKAVADMYEIPDKVNAEEGVIFSTISDQMLFGMLLKITGKAENGFYPVKSFYGYEGYMSPECFEITGEKDAKESES